MTHDLIFFEKRSTPKVVDKGADFEAPESYGKQTSRRAATEEEEKVIARGDWLRVDQSGKKGGEDGYKKTRMKGREHLVQSSVDDRTEDFLAHYGVKGMKWGVRNAALKGMQKSGFSKIAIKNAQNSTKRTAAGVKAGQAFNRAMTPEAIAARSQKRKKVAKVAGGVLVAGGAAAGAAVLRSRGQQRSTAAAAFAQAGRQAARAASQRAEWNKSVKSVLDDIAQANKEQDDWMRSLGLGAVINNDRR